MGESAQDWRAMQPICPDIEVGQLDDAVDKFMTSGGHHGVSTSHGQVPLPYKDDSAIFDGTGSGSRLLQSRHQDHTLEQVTAAGTDSVVDLDPDDVVEFDPDSPMSSESEPLGTRMASAKVKEADASSTASQRHEFAVTLSLEEPEKPVDTEPLDMREVVLSLRAELAQHKEEIRLLRKQLSMADHHIEDIQRSVTYAPGMRTAMSIKQKCLKCLDRYHTENGPRTPSRVGALFTTVLVILVLIYTVLWIVRYEEEPPTETNHIAWSYAGGLQPMEVKCFSEKCWLWFSGCGNHDCVEMHAGEIRELGMCYKGNPSNGLTARWLPATGADDPHHNESHHEGLQIMSDMDYWSDEWHGVMPIGQNVLPGYQLATLVLTDNKTLDRTHEARCRKEWFLTFTTPDVPEASETPPACAALNAAHPSAPLARVDMQPFYFSKTFEKASIYLPLLAALGGAFDFVDKFCLIMYTPAYLFFGWAGLKFMQHRK